MCRGRRYMVNLCTFNFAETNTALKSLKNLIGPTYHAPGTAAVLMDETEQSRVHYSLNYYATPLKFLSFAK